jgi:hypothetical protein
MPTCSLPAGDFNPRRLLWDSATLTCGVAVGYCDVGAKHLSRDASVKDQHPIQMLRPYRTPDVTVAPGT